MLFKLTRGLAVYFINIVHTRSILTSVNIYKPAPAAQAKRSFICHKHGLKLNSVWKPLETRCVKSGLWRGADNTCDATLDLVSNLLVPAQCSLFPVTCEAIWFTFVIVGLAVGVHQGTILGPIHVGTKLSSLIPRTTIELWKLVSLELTSYVKLK